MLAFIADCIELAVTGSISRDPEIEKQLAHDQTKKALQRELEVEALRRRIRRAKGGLR